MMKEENNKPNHLPGATGRRKTKYVNLYADEGDEVVLVPGRHKCDCQALKHTLINNCISCGRIVCEQEGSGPCSYCGEIVCTKEERGVLNRGSHKSDTLYNVLKHKKRIDNDKNGSLNIAIEHKNKLLEYDKTSEQRTKVYDDQSDYFQSSSSWIDPVKKEKLRKLEEEMNEKKYDRSQRKYTIDVIGRKITEDKMNMDNVHEEVKKILEHNKYEQDNSCIFSCNGEAISRPIFVESEPTEKNKISCKFSLDIERIQDKELKEMCDDGMCLSMHQPWASLLIKGIKKHEGRGWYSSHRGRLWIAAAAKPPSDDEVNNIENVYKYLYHNKKITFPRSYPTGCLLGYVQVEDVMQQEDYQEVHVNGESESPYVFICNNPVELPIKFPMKGEYKIYKIPEHIHKAAKNSLKGFSG